MGLLLSCGGLAMTGVSIWMIVRRCHVRAFALIALANFAFAARNSLDGDPGWHAVINLAVVVLSLVCVAAGIRERMREQVAGWSRPACPPGPQ